MLLVVLSQSRDNASCSLQSERTNVKPFRPPENHRTLSHLCWSERRPLLQALLSIWPTSCFIHQPLEPRQPLHPRPPRMMDCSDLEGEVGERAWRDEEREGERNKHQGRESVVCVCMRDAGRKQAMSSEFVFLVCPLWAASACCVMSCWHRGSLASCSSHPISLLTDCPDPALLFAAPSADSELLPDSYYLTSLSSSVVMMDFIITWKAMHVL